MTKMKDGQVVYILLNKKNRHFFIARGAENTLRETYRHHLKMRRDYSKDFVKACLPERPCLFILERIDPECEENLMLIWLRIFLDNGYTCHTHPDIIDAANTLYLTNQLAYDKRKDIDLSKLLSCDNCILPIYNRSCCPDYPGENLDNTCSKSNSFDLKKTAKRGHAVHLHFTEQEYAQIELIARSLKMQVSPYLHRVAKNPIIRPYNFNMVSEHTKEISMMRREINRLVYTIEVTNYYLPKELITIIQIFEHLLKLENELLITLRKIRHSDQEKDIEDVLSGRIKV